MSNCQTDCTKLNHIINFARKTWLKIYKVYYDACHATGFQVTHDLVTVNILLPGCARNWGVNCI